MRLSPFHDGIPVVASNADRAARFPSPSTNQRVWNLGSGWLERWNGSTWVGEVPMGAGGNLGVFNVKDPRYGATGDGVTNDATAIQAAITAAEDAGGGIVFLPRGDYIVNSTLTFTPTSTETLELRGEGTRHTFIYPNTAGLTAIRTGAATPDTSGTTTNAHYYGRLTDLSVIGSLAPTGCGIKMVEPHRWVVRNVNIEQFDGVGGTGLYLLGSTTSGGVGASAAPHAWRNQFYSVLVATTRRPLIIENGDENEFFGCNFALPPTGITGLADDSLIAIEIIQGRNNRGFGGLLSGHAVADADRAQYAGLKFCQPVNGDVLGNVWTGIVAEGFNKPVWFDGAAAVANGVRDYNSSINAVEFTDDAAQQGTRCFVDAPYHHINYRNSRSQYTDAIGFAPSDATPSVQIGNVFATVNGSATTITNFDDGKNGQVIWVRLDANTTVQDNASIRCSGGADITGAASMLVSFVNIGGTWYQASPTVTDA